MENYLVPHTKSSVVNPPPQAVSGGHGGGMQYKYQDFVRKPGDHLSHSSAVGGSQ